MRVRGTLKVGLPPNLQPALTIDAPALELGHVFVEIGHLAVELVLDELGHLDRDVVAKLGLNS